MKNLIVCGCSFTHGHHLSTDETWGAFVSKKQNWKFHNIAQGGHGNEWITQRTIAYLENNEELKKNSTVIIGWSGVTRLLEVFQSSPNDQPQTVHVSPNDYIEGGHGNTDHWDKSLKNYHGYALKHGLILAPMFTSFSFCWVKTYQAIFNLKNYLELNNIPYIFFDALAENRLVSIYQLSNSDKHRLEFKTQYGKQNSFIDEIIPAWVLNYLNDKFADKIFDNKFIKFNGNSMDAEMHLKDHDFFTHGNEGHPNLNACEYFSELIIQEYKKLYNYD
jgi:hypothetical protein